MTASHLHLVVPHTVDDPRHPSGGNVYDRELARELWSLGRPVRRHLVPSPVPRGRVTRQAVGRALATVPDGATVLVDGLVGLDAGPELTRERDRLRLWLLVHLPLTVAETGADARDRERAAVTAVAGVVATSEWTRDRLLATHPLDPARVHAAPPGVRPAALARPRDAGGRLVFVGAVVPAKGADLLVHTLAGLTDLPWTCRLVGPVDRAADVVDRLRAEIRDRGLDDRLTLIGPQSPRAVAATLQEADLLVLPSRMETYGMVLTEALARGVPVLASDVGGVREAVGLAADGTRPGLLVPAGDTAALRIALVRWLTEPALRRRLRVAAQSRRDALPAWTTTARLVRDAVDLNRSGPTTVVPA